MQSGIYQILNLQNDKFYIGSATNFKRRWWVHLCKLRKDIHDNKHLQSAFNLYGENCFKFEILEYCSIKQLLEKEQFWLDWTQACKVGYNKLPIAGNSLGHKHSEEFKKNRSEQYTGRKQSPELIEKRIAPLRGRKLSEEVKKKYSLAKLGNKGRLGKKHTEESKLKMSLTKKIKADMKLSPLSLENEIKWRKPPE